MFLVLCEQLEFEKFYKIFLVLRGFSFAGCVSVSDSKTTEMMGVVGWKCHESFLLGHVGAKIYGGAYGYVYRFCCAYAYAR